MVLGLAMQTYGAKLGDEQEVLMYLADILIDVYAADSACLRAAAAGSAAPAQASLHVDAARVFVNDAALRIDASARQALAAMLGGDSLQNGARRLAAPAEGRHPSTRSRCAAGSPTRPSRGEAISFEGH